MNTAPKIDLSMDMQILRSFLMTVPHSKWTTQSVIREQTGLRGVTVRQVCQHYPALFVSSTTGYKLASKASPQEIQHCVATLLSRSEKMIARASALSGLLVR